MSELTPETRMLIGGRLVTAEGDRTFDNVNPATEHVIGVCADGSVTDAKRAVAAAREAFDRTDWSTNPAFRQACLEQLQEALENNRELFREELIAESGIARGLTRGPALDVPIDTALRFCLDTLSSYRWTQNKPTVEVFGVETRRQVWREPVGVVGVIVPWNFPFELNLAKVGQILAAGNAIVLKPSPETPWSATRLGRIIQEETDIPAGIVNVVPSTDPEVGAALTTSPDVDMISFTGSTRTGQEIMRASAGTLKRLALELGGKSAMIVLDDADFAATVPMAAFACFHGGQGCALQTRLLLPRSRYEEGLAILTEAFEAVSWGDPEQEGTIMGPLINAAQRDRVRGYIAAGLEEGARMVVGADTPLPERGFYVAPTLFADVDNSMTIAQEEIFGPVQVVIAFEDDDDAVRIANDSLYGLSGSVFSGSEERAVSVARRIRTGTVSVNGGNWAASDVPFGGAKASGFGLQNGIEGFEYYLRSKTVGLPAVPSV